MFNTFNQKEGRGGDETSGDEKGKEERGEQD
jgi:hypothetical protein